MSAARTERLLNLLTLLLNARRPVTLREIRRLEEFRAYRTGDPRSGERAFERDKAVLLELGVPIRWIPPDQDEEPDGDSGGYLIDRERYFLPELNLEPTDVALLSIAGAAAVAIDGFPGRAAIIRALAKLGFDADPESPTPTLAHTPIQRDAERQGHHLEILHDAVAQRWRVDLEYDGMAGARTERRVDPYGLYYRHGAWYLVGHCHLRRDVRTFHLGRVRALELANRARARASAPEFAIPDGFDLSQQAARRSWEFPVEEPLAVRIRLAPRLVPAIPEIFGPHAQVTARADGAWVDLQVTSTAALVATILPYGAAAEVVQPPALRARLREIYRALAERHAEASS